MCDSFCMVLTAGPREANRLFLEPRRHLLSLGSKKPSWSRSLDLRVSRSQILQEGQRFGSGMKYGINARSELSLVAATG